MRFTTMTRQALRGRTSDNSCKLQTFPNRRVRCVVVVKVPSLAACGPQGAVGEDEAALAGGGELDGRAAAVTFAGEGDDLAGAVLGMHHGHALREVVGRDAGGDGRRGA